MNENVITYSVELDDAIECAKLANGFITEIEDDVDKLLKSLNFDDIGKSHGNLRSDLEEMFSRKDLTNFHGENSEIIDASNIKSLAGNLQWIKLMIMYPELAFNEDISIYAANNFPDLSVGGGFFRKSCVDAPMLAALATTLSKVYGRDVNIYDVADYLDATATSFKDPGNVLKEMCDSFGLNFGKNTDFNAALDNGGAVIVNNDEGYYTVTKTFDAEGNEFLIIVDSKTGDVQKCTDFSSWTSEHASDDGETEMYAIYDTEKAQNGASQLNDAINDRLTYKDDKYGKNGSAGYATMDADAAKDEHDSHSEFVADKAKEEQEEKKKNDPSYGLYDNPDLDISTEKDEKAKLLRDIIKGDKEVDIKIEVSADDEMPNVTPPDADIQESVKLLTRDQWEKANAGLPVYGRKYASYDDYIRGEAGAAASADIAIAPNPEQPKSAPEQLAELYKEYEGPTVTRYNGSQLEVFEWNEDAHRYIPTGHGPTSEPTGQTGLNNVPTTDTTIVPDSVKLLTRDQWEKANAGLPVYGRKYASYDDYIRGEAGAAASADIAIAPNLEQPESAPEQLAELYKEYEGPTVTRYNGSQLEVFEWNEDAHRYIPTGHGPTSAPTGQTGFDTYSAALEAENNGPAGNGGNPTSSAIDYATDPRFTAPDTEGKGPDETKEYDDPGKGDSYDYGYTPPKKTTSSYTLTIKYVYSHNPSYTVYTETKTLKSGDAYNFTPRSAMYYNATPSIITGVMPGSNFEVLVTYMPINDINGNGKADEEENLTKPRSVVEPVETPSISKPITDTVITDYGNNNTNNNSSNYTATSLSSKIDTTKSVADLVDEIIPEEISEIVAEPEVILPNTHAHASANLSVNEPKKNNIWPAIGIAAGVATSAVGVKAIVDDDEDKKEE